MSYNGFLVNHLKIREETSKDGSGVRAVNLAAFPTSAEADLVDDLRKQAQPIISWLAETDNKFVGHILFSPVSLSGHPGLKLMGLAPLSVLPEYQNRGVGSALVNAGLKTCQKFGYGAVVVLGSPSYYQRFGFISAKTYQISCEFEAQEGTFMLLELLDAYLKSKSGFIRYHAAFKSEH